MPRTPSANRIAEAARKIRITAERELAKALKQVNSWRAVLASLAGAAGTAPATEASGTQAGGPRRRKPGAKPGRSASGRRTLDVPILRALAGGPLSTMALAGRTGSSYAGTGKALQRLARSGKVKSKKAGRERIWRLASADAKPAARKARRLPRRRMRKKAR